MLPQRFETMQEYFDFSENMVGLIAKRAFARRFSIIKAMYVGEHYT